jgi:hypothetical protein
MGLETAGRQLRICLHGRSSSEEDWAIFYWRQVCRRHQRQGKRKNNPVSLTDCIFSRKANLLAISWDAASIFLSVLFRAAIVVFSRLLHGDAGLGPIRPATSFITARENVDDFVVRCFFTAGSGIYPFGVAFERFSNTSVYLGGKTWV